MLKTIFQSAQMTELVKRAKVAAQSSAAVFITGENGVGKEHIARILHDCGPRKDAPFIAVNCAALPKDLFEAELFGARKGSYTGSVTDRKGLFLEAGQGTIFLDEIAEMPVEMQSKLLRVLQDRTVRPLGEPQSYPLECRVVAATNRKVEEALKVRSLRTDLYFRLSTISLMIPALRERPDDIKALAEHFFSCFVAEEKKTIDVADDVIPFLTTGYWQGNVRQLQNAIHQAVIFSEDGKITKQAFSDEIFLKVEAPQVTSIVPKSTTSENVIDFADNNYNLDDLTCVALKAALKYYGGNKLKAARALGVGRQTFYNYLKRFGLFQQGDTLVETVPTD